MPLNARRKMLVNVALLLACLWASLVGSGCARNVQEVRPTVPRPVAHEDTKRRPRVVITVGSPTEAGSPVLVDEEYVKLLQSAIEEHWHGGPAAVSRPLSIELVLASDGGVSALRVASRSGDSELDHRALEAVARGHRTTVTGELRLYVAEGGGRRRCFSCRAKMLVTLNVTPPEE